MRTAQSASAPASQTSSTLLLHVSPSDGLGQALMLVIAGTALLTTAAVTAVVLVVLWLFVDPVGQPTIAP